MLKRLLSNIRHNKVPLSASYELRTKQTDFREDRTIRAEIQSVQRGLKAHKEASPDAAD